MLKGVRVLSQLAQDDNMDDEPYEDHLTDSKTEIKEAGERVLLLEKQLEELNVVPGVYRFMHLPCVAHKCHIIVEKSINNRLHCFGSIVKKCRSTVVKYRQSTKAKALLRAYYPRYTYDSFLILITKTSIQTQTKLILRPLCTQI